MREVYIVQESENEFPERHNEQQSKDETIIGTFFKISLINFRLSCKCHVKLVIRKAMQKDFISGFCLSPLSTESDFQIRI